MKPTSTLTSLAVAASLVGAIGLAYAQGGTFATPQQAQMGATDGTPNNNSTMNNGTVNNDTVTPDVGRTPGAMQQQNRPMDNQMTPLPPQADRN